MMVGALVLPATTSGMIEASTTRKASSAVDAQARVDDRRLGVGAHRAGSDRMVDGVDPPAQEGADFIVALRRVGAEQFARPMGAQRRRVHQPLRQFDARDERFDVLRLGEKGGVDQRIGERVGAGELQRSAALRLQRADVAGHAAAPAQLARVILDHGDDEMELDVGLGEIGTRLEETAGLGEVGRRHATPFAAIAGNRRDERRQRAERQADQVARREA